MINPQHKDLNRPVVCMPYNGPERRGIISAFNGHHVYVQYGEGPASKAERRIDLFWPEDVA